MKELVLKDIVSVKLFFRLKINLPKTGIGDIF